MAYKNVNPFSKQITILSGLFVVGMMSFGLALSYYKNILFDRQLDVMKERNNKLKGEIIGDYKQLEYLRSAQYKDKYAKENLNRVNVGENVLILMNENINKTYTPLDIREADEQREARYEQLLRTMNIFEHWNIYLFNRDKVDELKKSL